MMNEKSLFHLVLTPLTCSPRLLINMVNNAMLQRISRYHRVSRRTQFRLLDSCKKNGRHFSDLKSRYEKESDFSHSTLASIPIRAQDPEYCENSYCDTKAIAMRQAYYHAMTLPSMHTRYTYINKQATRAGKMMVYMIFDQSSKPS